MGMRTWFRNAAVLSMGGIEGVLLNADLLVDGNRITRLGETLEPAPRADRTIDARDKLIMPGLINAHYHSHNNYFRGRFDNSPLDVCVLHLWNIGVPPDAVQLTPREIYARTLLGCAEMLRSGTTTVIDDVNLFPWLHEEIVQAVMQAYEDSGMRVVVALHVFDVPYMQTMPFVAEYLSPSLKQRLPALSAPDTQTVIGALRSCARRWGHDRGRVRLGLGPSGPQRCSDRLLAECANLSEEFDLPVYVHVLESRTQAVLGKLGYGKTLVEHLRDLGVLSPRVSFGHAVWVTPGDIDIIAKAGVTICHNPVSNLKLGSGIAPIQEFLRAGVPVALGTDGVMSNDSLNMFETMKFAALLHKVREPDPGTWLGAREALRMATAGSARSCRHEDVGEIRVGARADLLVLDLKRASYVPRNDLVLQTVFAENGSSIEMVMIDGKFVVENSRHKTLDEAALADEVNRNAIAFHERVSNAGQNWGTELSLYFARAFKQCWQVDVGTEAFGPPRHDARPGRKQKEL
jgi:cytosine/adenosine deaminase-related metal-dependent hydrolase